MPRHRPGCDIQALAESMGIDTDWNCAISLRPLEDSTKPDPHRMTSDYADWDVKVPRSSSLPFADHSHHSQRSVILGRMYHGVRILHSDWYTTQLFHLSALWSECPHLPWFCGRLACLTGSRQYGTISRTWTMCPCWYLSSPTQRLRQART